MKRILLSLATLGAFAIQASAVLNLELANGINTFTLAPGTSVLISGDIVGVEGDVASYTFLPGSGFSFAPDPQFTAYIASVTTASYGSQASPLPLGRITAGAAPGLYTNVLAVQDPSAPNGNGGGQADGENISVRVTPEPASFAALGVGVVALIRRRRKA